MLIPDRNVRHAFGVMAARAEQSKEWAVASKKKPSESTSSIDSLKPEKAFLGSILEHHQELELTDQQFTILSQMYWARSGGSTITGIVEGAASTLSSNQLYRAIALMAPPVGTVSSPPGDLDATVQGMVTEALEKFSKDKQLVEVELASKAAERLMGWAKIFAFFLAAPAALGLILLGAVGFSKFENVQKASIDIDAKVLAAQRRVDAVFEKIDPLQASAIKTQKQLDFVQQELSQQGTKVAALSDTVAKLSEKRRYALVIGNDTYMHLPSKVVPGAIDDARGVAEALRTLGFLVKQLSNANSAEMSSELKRLQIDVTAGAEIAVVYFAGQSAAIRPETLLIPSDAIDNNVEATAITLSMVINAVSKAIRVGLVFVDACHNSASLFFSGACLDPRDRIPDNVVLGYAAKPESPLVGESKYARALSKNLVVPGLELMDMLEKVSLEVFKWKAEGPLSRPIYLKPAEPPLPAAR
jgi:hypothetical protein